MEIALQQSNLHTRPRLEKSTLAQTDRGHALRNSRQEKAIQAAGAILNLKQHFLKLCADEEASIQWCDRPLKSLAVSDGSFELILAPRIKSAVSYAVAMHELGHVKSRAQSNNQIERERAAWDWARRNAMIWTPRMERYAMRSLKWYERQATKAGRLPDLHG